MKFTLPLATGNYPFRLTEEDKVRNSDNWAWSFLRFNPLYRHDFNLVQVEREVRPHLEEARRLIFRFRMATRPDESPSILHPKPIPAAPTELPKEVAELDSRYFNLDSKPLHRKFSGFDLDPATLQEWLDEQCGIEDMARLEVRGFDAPRDYGIAAWIHPDLQSLEELQPGWSWFQFMNEPVWGAGTWALRASTAQRTHTPASGGKIVVGLESCTEVFTERVEKHAPDFLVEAVNQLVPGRPVPLNLDSTRSTALYFLICLDGYIEPQLKAMQPIANYLKALHKKYYPKAVQRGSLPNFAPIIENPHCPETRLNSTLSELFTTLIQVPTRSRKNWRAVTIDVAAPLIHQFEYLSDQLMEIQESLGDQLTFPLRKRTGRTGGDHWLKRNLCMLELYFYGYGAEKVRPSQLAIARAFYDEGDPMYQSIRGEPAAQNSNPSKIKKSSSNAAHPKSEIVREALENAQSLALGWYEFIAWSGAHLKA